MLDTPPVFRHLPAGLGPDPSHSSQAVPNSDLLELFAIFTDSPISTSTIESTYAGNNGDFEQTFLDLTHLPMQEFTLPPPPEPPRSQGAGKSGFHLQALKTQPTVDDFDDFAVFQRNLAMRTRAIRFEGKPYEHNLTLLDLDRAGAFQTLLLRFSFLMPGERYKISIILARDKEMKRLVKEFARDLGGVEKVEWREVPLGLKGTFTIDSYQPLATRPIKDQAKKNKKKKQAAPEAMPG
jgi:hypothetical protein